MARLYVTFASVRQAIYRVASVEWHYHRPHRIPTSPIWGYRVLSLYVAYSRNQPWLGPIPAQIGCPTMNISSPFLGNLQRHALPGLLQGLAMLAVAAGLGVWAAILLAPTPSALPPALAPSLAPQPDTAAISAWFGGGNSRVRVALVGLIASDTHGAALLSIDGGSPQAFRAGQSIAPGVTLARVGLDHIEIDQEGASESLRAPANPHNVIQGFVPVR